VNVAKLLVMLQSRCRADFFSPPSPGYSRCLSGAGVTYESDLKELFVEIACNLDSDALQQLEGDEHAIALVQAAGVAKIKKP
jgi:hypothetical protein